jgi:Eukaryotic aspartyl protease
MPKVVRIPITNVYLDGAYTGQILVGPDAQKMNVMLDTGSSALALDGRKYRPNIAGGDQTTDIAQSSSYGNGGSWTGAVIRTTVAVGNGALAVSAPAVNAAIADAESANMFQGADGILGLAYAAIDDAYQMPGDTWSNQYPATRVTQGTATTIPPFLTQIAGLGIVSDKIAFYTRRSFIHQGGGGAADPLNQGWMILGGGEESTDLYTGAFQAAKVLADEWYNTNLKSITVGDTAPIAVRARGLMGMPSNSIVDSGTNSLNFGPTLLRTLLSRFSPSQQALLTQSISDGKPVDMGTLNLASWPTLTFVLQGDTNDVSLRVLPGDYWQVNAPASGSATAAITLGEDGLVILGLPLMNGYFTIFDGEADGGKGVIMFATSKR